MTGMMKTKRISKDRRMFPGHRALQVLAAVILFTIILFPYCLSDAEENHALYDRVILFALDAAGTSIEKADTPNFDRIFGDGCISYETKATVPTKSAQGWGSMFYGVPGPVHGTDNTTAEYAHKNNELYPSIFKLVRDAYPKARVAAFSNWHAITWGLIEWNDNGIDRYPAKQITPTMAQVYKQLDSYLAKRKPRLLMIYNGDVDTALHEYGYESKEYVEALKTADAEMGAVYDKLKKKGLLKNALVLFATDHGGMGTSHGGGSEQEIRCTFAVAGSGVEKHGNIEDMELQDVAAIVLYALGIEQPDIMTARVPKGIFPGAGGGDRKQSRIPEAMQRYGNPPSGTEAPALSFSDLLADKLVYYEGFDGDEVKGLNDPAGITEGYFGKGLKLRGSYVETGIREEAKWSGLTVGFWFYDTETTEGDPVFIADKNWKSGRNKGFVIAKSGDRILVNIGNGNKFRKDMYWILPEEYKNKWVHCLVTFNQASRTVGLYCDFEYIGSAELLPTKHNIWTSRLDMVIGQDVTKKYNEQMDAKVDEIMIFNQALTGEEIRELQARYTP